MGITSMTVTNKGLALLAKTPSGSSVPVTRWQFGTGVLPERQKLEELTRLVAPLKYFPISSVVNRGTEALVMGQFVNTGMDAFVWEELGLWAQDPDEGEVLYAVGCARGDGEPIEASEERYREFQFGAQLRFVQTTQIGSDTPASLIFATLEDLKKKADLVGGKVPPEQLPVSGGYYKTFDAEDWDTDDEDGAQLRIPQAVHGMEPKQSACMYRLRQRVTETGDGPPVTRLISSTWAVLESDVSWDTGTQELVIKSEESFAGDILVTG